ncbi:MAG: hypothetical protein APR62_07280 [Smithella sp. SDB]|jgi:uncharacterized protein with PQ loop repeat|nr:MAG: hypothetical protein APR62_07280 [Smithella sp. SDB]
MDKNSISLLIIVFFGIGFLVWGLYGIVNRKKINNRANYILSVSQFICGVMVWVFLIYLFLRKMFW